MKDFTAGAVWQCAGDGPQIAPGHPTAPNPNSVLGLSCCKRMNVTLLLSICFGLWLDLSSTPSVSAATAGSNLRYLFLIDSSQAVAQDKDAVAEAVAARLRTGFDGWMSAGELFVVWTFGGNTVSTDQYLPTPWQPRTSQVLSGHLARSLKDLPFQGEARLDKAITEAMKRFASSDSLTIVVVCSGSSAVVGTPFDDRINASFRQPLETTGTPAGVYMTTLFIHSGEMIGWSVQPVPGTASRQVARVDPP